jgi:hypothetical protein
MRKRTKISILVIACIIAISAAVYFWLPINRAPFHSGLVMLGDFNNDNKWDKRDAAALNEILRNPFRFPELVAVKADVNRNGFIDGEDVAMLRHLYRYSDPYEAEKIAFKSGMIFPRPRELFRYMFSTEYIQRPLYALKHDVIRTSPFGFLDKIGNGNRMMTYNDKILAEIYNEGIRFSLAFEIRRGTLSDVEKKYAADKISVCEALYRDKDYYNLLLRMIDLVEDAETLTVKGQSGIVIQSLYFRDHLRELLDSGLYRDFTSGKISRNVILSEMGEILKRDLSITLDMNTLSPPRSFLKLENYAERAEWQYYKSKTRKDAFGKLILYAQYDQRYLRAVSRTTPRHDDLKLKNHNLPMVLLFREALRITGGNKKAAVGLLDESVRIPFGWIKVIPPDKLPASLALENFLLPGNREDGSDKSRHWNVFGGISLYKSPRESLIVALKREISDLKGTDRKEAMTEFIRDMIANINGIYHVVSVNPHLIYDED